jgi:hypothetical protein
MVSVVPDVVTVPEKWKDEAALRSAAALLAICSAVSDASGSPGEVPAEAASEEAEGEDAGVTEVELAGVAADEHAVMNRGMAAAVTAAAFTLERIGVSLLVMTCG